MDKRDNTGRTKTQLRVLSIVCHVVLVAAVCGVDAAGDWSTYRHDITRSGVSEESVGPELFLQWKYTPVHAPKPAWPMPSEELPRMHIDNAYHAAVADGSVYFGSSVTNKIYAVDADSGDVRWTFFTQGPVRFAPTVYDGKVYAGSDDGYVYCLGAEDGSLIWKYRPSPSDEKVIGNGRMISLWPVRTSVLADEGNVYFAAGVFPYEGLYICALRAEDGSEVWKNDTIGDRAHELQYGGISPHGYLVASPEILYVPSGRAMPAAFDRQTGKFLFYASSSGKRGGAWTLLADDRLIAGVDYSGVPHKAAYDAKTGKMQGDAFAWFPGVDLVVTRDVSYVLTKDGIYAIDRNAYADALKETEKLTDRRKQLGSQVSGLREKLGPADETAREKLNQQIDEVTGKIREAAEEESQLKESTLLWRYAGEDLCSLILAGGVMFAGGDGKIVGIDAETGEEVWKTRIEGSAPALAAGGGCLVASSDTGAVYCFAGSRTGTVNEIVPALHDNPFPNDAHTEMYKTAIERILMESDARKGYCLVLDCNQGRLAYELAQVTELQIVGLETDPEKLAAARNNLERAGLLGSRVVVEPWGIEDLPDYFANLIVSDSTPSGGRSASRREQSMRVLRPWGGVACIAVHEEQGVRWVTHVRGELEGAGSWTQQYGDPQNTACSDDELVNGPLGILWFGEPGPQGMVERHGRAQSPLAMNGRLFIEGEDLVMAVDSFNGTLLWERKIPGAVRVKIKADSGNLAVTENGLYVAAYDKCYRLDPATGETVRVYDLPVSRDGRERRWGYVSVVDNILYGSAAAPMDEDYGAVLKVFLEDDKWRPIENVPELMRERYTYYKNQYPDPHDLRMATQRSGALYRTMTSFGRGGEFTQKNGVTDNLMAGDKVFALNTETGDVLWTHDGTSIANIAVVFGEGKIFLADSTVNEDQRKRALERKREFATNGAYKQRDGILEELAERKKQLAGESDSSTQLSKRELEYLIDSLQAELYEDEDEDGALSLDDADVRLVTALDAVTGQKLWEHPVDLTGCGGDKMGAAYRDGLLFFFGNHGNHDAWRFRIGGMKWRRITALAAENGDMAWSRPLNYRTRPVLVGDKIILEPRACDLRTGETVLREHPITGEQVPWEFLRPGHTCGVSAASAEGLFYRSACTAFYDLEEDRGVTIFGAYRPGCAISVIPANGLLLSAEASAGCTCSYPIRCSVALKRKPNRSQPWTVFVTPGSLSPAKHFAINLGAVADMKDDQGVVWFGYPNPKTDAHTHFPNYGVKFDLRDRSLPGMGYFSRDFKGVELAGTDKPWLFTSGCLGLTQCTLPLVDDDAGQEPRTYTVRLGFKAMPGDRAGQRVFDIKLQNDVVLEDCDPVQIAGSLDAAVVKEFKNVRVENDLVLELVPNASEPKAAQAPLLNFIEVIREDIERVSGLPGSSEPAHTSG